MAEKPYQAADGRLIITEDSRYLLSDEQAPYLFPGPKVVELEYNRATGLLTWAADPEVIEWEVHVGNDQLGLTTLMAIVNDPLFNIGALDPAEVKVIQVRAKHGYFGEYGPFSDTIYPAGDLRKF